MDVLNHASATGDVTEWRRITAPGCDTCVALADDIVATGPDSGGQFAVESTKVTEVNPGVFSTVAFVVDQEPYVNLDGTPNEGGRFALLLAMRFTESWVIEELDIADPDAPWAS